jgi:transposase-like protein
MHRAVQSYTDGFKRDAGRLATAPDNPVAGVAKEPDADRTISTEWVTFNGSTQQR